MSDTPRLTIVNVVTREHGETFAEEWYDLTVGYLEMLDAFEKTGVLKWPHGGLDEGVDARWRYEDIVDEIYERAFTELRPAVAEVFVRIAGEVLARERDR